MANEKFNVVGANIAEKASMIWNVADMLSAIVLPVIFEWIYSSKELRKHQ